MVAVKNVATSYLKKLPTKHLVPQQDNSLLHSIYEMLTHISEPQMAVACASWVATRMPPGKFLLYKYITLSRFYDENPWL